MRFIFLHKVCTVLSFSIVLSLVACVSGEEALRRLDPPASFADIQLSDIEALISTDPEAAIHAIGRFDWRYLAHEEDEDRRSNEERDRLADMAAESMQTALAEAIGKKDWSRALSLSRSVAAAALPAASGTYRDILLMAAGDDLAENRYLLASLRVREAHALAPVPDDLLASFFVRAVARKERGTAAWFLNQLESSSPARLALDPGDLAWAGEALSPADMIDGVVTVWVDRGLKIEQGNASLDRVIGSAFFVSSDGLMVTNHHVIESLVDPGYEGYARLYVRTAESTGPRIPARVIGWDPLMDLALLQADIPTPYVYSVLDAADPLVGSDLLAIGSPAGLEKTVTQGIVSASKRRLLQLGDVFQLDAAVNQGNSGGPAVDRSGRLAGVVFAGVPSFQGLNFAVPATRLRMALPALLEGGGVSRPWLGVALHESARGLECVYVTPSSPAASQLVEAGSFITAVGGVPLPRSGGIVAAQDVLFACRPGELVRIDFADGSRRLLALQKRPEQPVEELARLDSRERALGPILGLFLGWSGSGVFAPEYQVSRVLSGSIADETGISERDSLSIVDFSRDKERGFGIVALRIKRRTAGYLEALIRIPFSLQSSDFL